MPRRLWIHVTYIVATVPTVDDDSPCTLVTKSAGFANMPTREAKPMGRPRAAVRIDSDFRVRLTSPERDALDQIVESWAKGRAVGGLVSPGDGNQLWFRLLVRDLAAKQGIEIVDEVPAPVKAPAKPAKKGGATKRPRSR